MNNWIRNTSLTGLFLMSICGLANASLQKEIHDVHYNFLPANVVVENVMNRLQAQGINTAGLDIVADAQGVVNVVGKVTSKQEAEAISRAAMHTAGVYGVLGYFKYDGVSEDGQVKENSFE